MWSLALTLEPWAWQRARWRKTLIWWLGQRRAIQAACLILFTVLFFVVAWPYAPVFTADLFEAREFLPAEIFLSLDPLLGFSNNKPVTDPL